MPLSIPVMSSFLSFRGNNNINYNDTQDADIALEPLTTHPEEWAEQEESKHTVHKKYIAIVVEPT